MRSALFALSLLAAPAFAAPSIQVGFSPEGSARTMVLAVINHAQKSINMIAYAFQAPDITAALEAAAARGVKVQLVADFRRNQNGKSQRALSDVASHGVEVRTDAHYHIQHDKTIIVDGSTIETGSFNYAPSAETENSENVLVIRHAPAITAQYLAHWRSRWRYGVPFTPEPKPAAGTLAPLTQTAHG
ncbi:phospholipase D family protein [Enterobacter sp. CC120223-11]|uniref:phospholipase D family nuclease n=1 Tax=Enterobacter sp. CC120223-11 TaxID=1378073 RepID=UPI000BC4499B|nr:phospholipase D family protein [Enterobacter sp. CC120223-11]SNY77461.1 Phosphatidylserine/phosphatidylglycerophosphate/cardiolipin synthases and related enzymes [Enterobacter sp. CC120223-11]